MSAAQEAVTEKVSDVVATVEAAPPAKRNQWTAIIVALGVAGGGGGLWASVQEFAELPDRVEALTDSMETTRQENEAALYGVTNKRGDVMVPGLLDRMDTQTQAATQTTEALDRLAEVVEALTQQLQTQPGGPP